MVPLIEPTLYQPGIENEVGLTEFLCLLACLLTLHEHVQEPSGEAQFQRNVSCEGITDTTIALQLLLFGEIGCRGIFDRPETMPTGTRDDGSGFCCPATENDTFIPMHAEGGLDEETRRNERNALFVQHLLGQSQSRRILCRCTPD